jgi:hypothetical protein
VTLTGLQAADFALQAPSQQLRVQRAAQNALKALASHPMDRTPALIAPVVHPPPTMALLLMRSASARAAATRRHPLAVTTPAAPTHLVLPPVSTAPAMPATPALEPLYTARAVSFHNPPSLALAGELNCRTL